MPLVIHPYDLPQGFIYEMYPIDSPDEAQQLGRVVYLYQSPVIQQLYAFVQAAPLEVTG